MKYLVLVLIMFAFLIPTPLSTECNCTHLEILQIELRNAQRLQQAFRTKIPQLQAMSHEQSVMELQRFAKTDARRDMESLPNYKGAGEVDYDAQGSSLYDPIHPKSTDTNESLCKMTSSSQAALQQAMQSAACSGIGRALQAHEDVHRNSCMTRGFVNFFGMNGADRAQEEADAYGAQIKVLRAEIAQVLERAQFTVISDVKTRAQFPTNPLYVAEIIENHAEILTSSASGSADRFRFEGQGQQTTNVRIEGNCTVNGVPFSVPARVSVDTDGLTADVGYELTGTMPSIGMRCTLAQGSGYGMSIPVPMNSGKMPIAKLPLRDGAEVEFDMAQSEAARIMARGGVTLTGKATVRLVCHK